MANGPLDPAADFRDDGGTPSFRARLHAERMASFWAVIRFIWLFPLVGTFGLFLTAMMWLMVAVFVGEATARDNWFILLVLGPCVAWWSTIPSAGGIGKGPLDIRRMMNSPSGGAWGAIATYFRTLFVTAYACYAIFFWLIAGIALWAWQSGSWQHAMATAGAG